MSLPATIFISLVQTVQHELILAPLQYYMTARYRPYRDTFSTPFWVEELGSYWEMLLWDLGFPKTPEDRMVCSFVRKHRCARIVFSLGYHFGQNDTRTMC